MVNSATVTIGENGESVRMVNSSTVTIGENGESVRMVNSATVTTGVCNVHATSLSTLTGKR